MFLLIPDDPSFAPMLEDVGRREHAVVERIASGDHAGAAEQFAEPWRSGLGRGSSCPLGFGRR